MRLWSDFCAACKSRSSALARSCFLGRERARQKVRELKQQLRAQRAQAKQERAGRAQLEEENRSLQQRVLVLEAAAATPRPLVLPLGDLPKGQQFGDGMITLCVNLARKIGLRPTVAALDLFFAWLNVTPTIPRYQTIRLWMQRLGLDRMRNVDQTDGDVWLADHSNQIGKEKVLTILRVRAWKPGAALRLEDLDLVLVKPGESWKRAEVATAYQATATRCGTPRAVAMDGAVELREPVETLGTPEHRPLTLRDPKHFLANQLEALLHQDPHWEAFTQQLGGTRSALQQTEWAHFVPPSFKAKARFMNLAATLHWASTTLWHLRHPESHSRQGITPERLQDKLGWLEAFAAPLAQWQGCQAVIAATLTYLNTEGLFRGVAEQLRQRVAGLACGALSQELVERTLKFLKEHEDKLEDSERLPMSTEIVESAFGKYKQLERQQSKGGFTHLLLTFPVLLRATTAAEVRASFARVKVADVKGWEKENLPRTLAAKRQLLFREANPQAKRNRKKSATPKTTAA